MKDFQDSIDENPEILTGDRGGKKVSITSKLLKSSTHGTQLVLYDKDLMNEFDGETDAQVDATFNIVPKIKGVKQMLTILGKKHDIVSFMIDYAVRI